TLVTFALLPMLNVPFRPPRHIGKTILLGLFQTTGFVGLISWSLALGQAGKSAVLAYTMPFWVILFGWPFLGERLRGLQGRQSSSRSRASCSSSRSGEVARGSRTA